MVLGMVISSGLGRSERVRLVEGQPQQALGYALTFQGVDEDPHGRHILKVHVAAKDWSLEARPELFNMPRGEGVMRKPAISGPRELYLSPLELTREAEGAGEVTWLAQGEPVEAGGARYAFAGFRMQSHDVFEVAADIDVTRDGRTERVSPGMRADSTGSRPMAAEVPGLGPITVVRIDADNHRVGVRLPGGAPAGVAVVELSTKPLVNLVWVGALLALVGSALAGLRRAIEVNPAAPRRQPARAGAGAAEAAR
jgi:cytochrome c-type biogenesis protein CcmF